jgi:catechol 2,3-dioxygenase-like lactoylglutathione lyase family enzyme
MEVTDEGGTMNDQASVRYLVDKVDDAVEFYVEQLDFEVVFDAAPDFVMLSRGPLKLMLNVVGGSGGASQPMPDGRVPEPGGWSRFQLLVDDLESDVARLRSSGASFRNDIVNGIGGKQILLEDPSGNLIELFEPLQS